MPRRGGVILFRGSGAAARRYAEADRSRADGYDLGAGDAVAAYALLDASGEVTAALHPEVSAALDVRDPGWAERCA